MSLHYNANFPHNFTPIGASNDTRYPHNESTSTSAPLRNASMEQSIFHCCTVNPHLFFREYPSDDTDITEQTFPSLSLPSQTTFSHQLSCPQTIYGARSRQHVAMERHRRTTQRSPLSFPTPSINHIREPSASMRLSQGNNGTNLVAFDNPMNDHAFPKFTYNAVHGQDQNVFSGTNRVISDVQQQQTSFPEKKRSRSGVMGVEYGFSEANMKFNDRQHSRSLSSARYPMPITNTSNGICVEEHSAAQVQIKTQSNSSSTEDKRHLYSSSVSVDGTRWHCNGCEYTTEREQDMIRHCSTLRHGGSRFFTCPSCGKRFSRKDSVTRHSKNRSCGLRRAPLSESSGH